MIAVSRGGARRRSIIADPFTKRIFLPLKFPGLSLLGWKLCFH
jgi:hypothetical protein